MRTNSPRRRSNDFVSHVTDITLIRYYWSNREEKEREREKCAIDGKLQSTIYDARSRT